MMKILRRLPTGFAIITLILLLSLAYGSIDNRFYRIVTIEGNSMAPTFHYGDLMVVTPPSGTVRLNSIVMMKVGNSLVTHRVIGFDEYNRPITKGDASQAADFFANPDKVIVGIYRFHLPGLGYPLIYLSQLLGV